MFWQEVDQKWWKQMTAVGCDAGLTSTTFHGSPLNPLLCGSCIHNCAETKFIRLVRRKEKQRKRPPVAFILTFRLSFGINASLGIYKEQPVRGPSKCSQLAQEHARAQISALSKPGSRWCCNNTDKSEHSAARSGRRRRGRHRLGVQTHGMGRFQSGFNMVPSRGHLWQRRLLLINNVFTSWRCLRTLTCLGKKKKRWGM